MVDPPPARSRLKQTPREIPLNHAAYEALRSDIAHVDGRVFRRWNAAAFCTFWRRLSHEAKVTDLHFHDLRHTFATWLQNLGVPLEVRERPCWSIDCKAAAPINWAGK